MTEDLPATLRLEIDSDTLLRLLCQGQMHVCELRCLDAGSKQALLRLLLDGCCRDGSKA